MTIRAAKFTPEVMLSAPRRSAGIPNSDGSKILYSVSTYSFDEHSKKSEIRMLDVESQQTSLITDSPLARSPTWLGDDSILLLVSTDEGETHVVVGETGDANKWDIVGEIPGPVGDLKIKQIDNDTFAFAVSGKATPDGELFNPEKAKKPLTSGRLYKKMFVRHWDHYVDENRNAIWLGRLTKTDGKFKLSELKNALKGTGLECPIQPFGGGDHFDISSTGFIFTAKDPDLDPAMHTKTNIYFSTASSFWAGDDGIQSIPTPQKIDIVGFEGASTSPVFSPNGKQAAFLSMKTDGYESDKNQLFIIPDTRTPNWVIHALASANGKGAWDRSPSSIIWTPDSTSMYLVAEDNGRICLFAYRFELKPKPDLPLMILKGGSISDVTPLKEGDLFISSSSFIDNSLYSLLPVHNTVPGHVFSLPDGIKSASTTTKYISSQTKNGGMFGLSRKQIDEIHWPGAAKGTKIHAWVVKPSFFDSKKKYPLAYLIHGGPQNSWVNGWSTRWNPAVFAEQGYIVIAPNPTGSTSYGQSFTDAIQGQWGGLPYEDLVLGFEWITANLTYVDTNLAVGLGASYGGYMMNWIQGHPLGRKFKALVTHDGVFSMTGQMASEELYFPFHDIGGTLASSPAAWAKWDPSRFTANWSTPHLIIHSELDYRLTMAEGLAAFHTLQTRGVESQFLTFPDENHWVLKPENSLLWHEVVLDWINGFVGLEKYTEARKRALEAERESMQ
ncbi:alpha/beta-hydrolase [Amniculicola lignicola CBS 123094]|uniref:Dipeptidyl-peptidase V n=1 Tax=Amniculicola lignicola CBS 123094 TaxID=1392246 RepID=A0A6A5WJH1_9PLEO|nr:alpha/beta-hydrolase [Amniculicola lignicola CBS 123094]